MLQRVEAMESELAGLVEAVRTGANRITADLSLLEGGMGDLYDAAGSDGGAPPARRVVESVPAVVPAAASEPVAAESEPEPEPVEPEPAVVAEEAEVADAPAEAPVASDGEDEDAEGARLVALNMALNGTSRDETDRYLAENFDLSDRAALLDEVYATVEP